MSLFGLNTSFIPSWLQPKPASALTYDQTSQDISKSYQDYNKVPTYVGTRDASGGVTYSPNPAKATAGQTHHDYSLSKLAPTGSVAGTSTSGSSTSGSSGGSPQPQQQIQQQDTGPSAEEIARREQEAREAQLRGEIESGYNDYFSQLDAMLNQGLPGQQQAQQQIIGNQFQSGLNTLGQQERSGLQNLGGERESAQSMQKKSLRDLSENMRNLFMAGNVYLGSRGAGDSSAANQYAYALNKQGTRGRSDVMAQTAQTMAEIGKRETQLKDIVATETRNLELERDNKLKELSTWFNEQQNQIRLMKGEGSLNKSRDLQAISRALLDNAIAAMNQIQTSATDRKTQLETWAMNNAQNINQLKQNMAGIGQFTAPGITTPKIAGTPTVDSQGNFNMSLTGMGGRDDEKLRQEFLAGAQSKSLFGR